MLGDHLKKRRLELKLTQREVACRIGVNDTTLTGWERNQHEPAVEHIPQVLAFLGYDPCGMPQSLGEQLRAARRRHGLTYIQLAARLGVHRGTMAMWEAGKTEPRARWSKIVQNFLY